MAVLVSKPGLTSASTLSIPKDWSAAWFRSLIANQLVGADVRNAVGANGISISGTIASPYATIGLVAPVTINGNSTAQSVVTINQFAETSPGGSDCAIKITGGSSYTYNRIIIDDSTGANSGQLLLGGSAVTIPGLRGQFALYTSANVPVAIWTAGAQAAIFNTNGSLQTTSSVIAGGNIQALGGIYYGLGSNNMMEDVNDGWLRLNQAGSYPNGVYTRFNFRADGSIYGYGSNCALLYAGAGAGGYSYGSWLTAGTSGGYWGYAMADARKTTFMSNGTDAGIYFQTAGAWMFYDDGTATRFVHEIVPTVDNSVPCGISTNRWSVIYSATGTINTSDARLKTNVQPSNLGLSFINALKPVSYRWIEGGQEVVEYVDADTPPVLKSIPGSRIHYGLLAQDVKTTLDSLNPGGDFAGWTLADKTDPTSMQGLRYDQFIAPLIKAVQELSAQVAALQAKVG